MFALSCSSAMVLPLGDEQARTALESAPDSGDYRVIAAVVLVGILFVIVAFLGAWLLRPRRPSAQKSVTYESGMNPEGQGWAQATIRYYLYGFIYVIFAVDVVYLLPWATVLNTLGWPALIEMAVFLGVLAAGLVYAWKVGVFKWQ